MGCFFGCFRVRDDRRTPIHLLSQSISSTPKDPVESVARNPLSSLLLFEAEDRDRSPSKDRKSSVLGFTALDINMNELKDEAKYLKACGTLPETPAEIRNNEKLKNSEPHNGDTKASAFHSWLQNASVEKLKVEKQPDQQPSPIKCFEEWESASDSSSRSPDSCVTGQTRENPTASFTPPVVSVQSRKKSVRFDCEIQASSFSMSTSSSAVTYQEPNPSRLPNDHSVSKPSPYPTPIRLTNDMQTPGTVFPAYLNYKEIGKNPRIRSQYVHPVLNPVENAARLKELKEKSFSSYDRSVEMEEYFEQADKENPPSQVNKGVAKDDKELNVDTSLSSWLPPKQPHQGRNNRLFLPVSQGTPGDRPILGTVAAHWNADEDASSPPKWWDGNGIPNSTNKYKEDQKVSWHATPFEERLEKALSEDKLIAERKQLGKVTVPAMELGEKEEQLLVNSG